MEKILITLLEVYEKNSYELKGRARVLLIFYLLLIPILIVFLIIFHSTAEIDFSHHTNIVIFTLLTATCICIYILYKGYYNISCSIITIITMLALLFNSNSTLQTGFHLRYIGSHFPYIVVIIFSMLFCKRIVSYIIIAIAVSGMVYNMLFNDILTSDELRVVLVIMLLTVALTTFICILILRITEQARAMRREDFEIKSNKQLEINKELLESLSQIIVKQDESSSQMLENTSSFSENLQKQAASFQEVTATIEEISAGTENVSVSVENQNKSLSSLMSKMDELLYSTRKMGLSTSDAMARAIDITRQAELGEKSINEMDLSMSEINSTSGEMTKILSIINDISDRINLLSLNAAIEAARAGDAGRGFAVVADEIGKLADQTSTSVKEIDVLIKKSESETNKGLLKVQDTVSAITSIIKGVNEINDMIVEIGKNMEINLSSTEIVNTDAGNVSELSEQIGIATQEQKKAADEIVQSVTYMNELSQSNAASAEEISANSEDIAEMSKNVSEKISTMDLENL